MGAVPPKIVLMGLRASGKTTLGRALAARLEVGFIDLDEVTAVRLGTPTAGEGLRARGEAAFRAAEVLALEDALRTDGVLALGGGTPTAPGAAAQLEACTSPVVYLHASAGELRDRLAASDQGARPALTDAGTVGEVDAVYAQRDPLFRELADAIVDTDDRDAERVLRELERVAAGNG